MEKGLFENVGTILAIGASAAALGYSLKQTSYPDTGGCDAEVRNPASWVICGIVDGGRSLTGATEGALQDGLETNSSDLPQN